MEKAYENLMVASDHGAPAPTSPAQHDIETAESLAGTNSEWTRERIHTLHALIHVRLAAASDNLAGTGTLLGQKGEGVFSPWSVARSVLEIAGIAYWLLEPGLTTESRLARSFTDRLVSIRGAARFGGKAGSQFDFKQRAGDVTALAGRLGMSASGSGLKVWVDQPQPSKTELVTELLGSRLSSANYSLFSGWAHGEAWALLDTLQRSKDTEDPSGTGRTLRGASLTFDHYQFIAALASKGFTNAVDRAVAYFGWASSDWELSVRRAFGAVGKAPTLIE